MRLYMDTVDRLTVLTKLIQDFAEMETMMHDDHKRAEMSGELADIFFFLLRFAQMNGFDLAKCLEDKMAYNELRYPVEKTKGSNLKYNELDT